MIQTKYGDLLEAKGVIVHGCNAQGKMQSGVAKQIRDKYPKTFDEYKRHLAELASDGVDPMGRVSYYFEYIADKVNVIICNMITQQYYGRDTNIVYVSYDAVRSGFRRLNVDIYRYNTTHESKITTVNFPLIGCGLGNGDSKIILKIIDEELDDSLEKILWINESKGSKLNFNS